MLRQCGQSIWSSVIRAILIEVVTGKEAMIPNREDSCWPNILDWLVTLEIALVTFRHEHFTHFERVVNTGWVT